MHSPGLSRWETSARWPQGIVQGPRMVRRLGHKKWGQHFFTRAILVTLASWPVHIHDCGPLIQVHTYLIPIRVQCLHEPSASPTVCFSAGRHPPTPARRWATGPILSSTLGGFPGRSVRDCGKLVRALAYPAPMRIRVGHVAIVNPQPSYAPSRVVARAFSVTAAISGFPNYSRLPSGARANRRAAGAAPRE